MEVIQRCEQAQQRVWGLRAGGQTVGLVPTMGALHEGHLSLARMSIERCDVTIASIFVNPTQFGPREDLNKYPRTLDRDCELLEAAGVSVVFVPTATEMYPPGFSTYIDPPEVAKSLEGVCRPGHFRGVTTVVMKLFQILPATHAFFGRKDYQQWKVIEAMVRDLNVGIEIVSGQTVRESDGLALSSRNRYLSGEGRQQALCLDAALRHVQQRVTDGQRDVATLQEAIRYTLLGGKAGKPAVDRIDYAVIVDAETLSPLDRLDRAAVAMIAAFVGPTRLIDNRPLTVS